MRNNLTMYEVKEARHIYEGLKTHSADVTSRALLFYKPFRDWSHIFFSRSGLIFHDYF